MPFNLTGAGGLLPKIGHHYGRILDLNRLMGSAIVSPDTMPNFQTQFNAIIADYAQAPTQYPIVQGGLSTTGVRSPGPAVNALSAWQEAQTSTLNYLVALATATLQDMVTAYAANVPPTTLMAIEYLINQVFKADGSGYYCTPSAIVLGPQVNGAPLPIAPYAASGNSGPVLVLSKLDERGFQLDNIMPETLTFACQSDAQTGGATPFRETVAYLGQAMVGTLLSFLWPAGSGCSGLLSCVDAAGNGGVAGNLLQNSEFSQFTNANVPDNWTIAVGAAGTQVLQALQGYQDNSCVEFVGDGVTLTSITQAFGVTPATGVGAGGTSTSLVALPDTQFAVNLWLKLSSAAATGWLQVDLIDNAGAQVKDDAGTFNAFHVDVSTFGDTAWHNLNGLIRTPAIHPAALPVKLRLSCPAGHALGGGNLFIDRLAMAQMQQLYAAPGSRSSPSPFGTGGGPFAAMFSGNLAPLLMDTWTTLIQNTMGNILQMFLRFFRMDLLGLRLPTAGTGVPVNDAVGGAGFIV